MDIKELQARLIDQSKTWFPEVWDRSLEERISYNTIGICGEAGEVANKIKKWMRQDDEAINNLSQVPEEMADVFFGFEEHCLEIGHHFRRGKIKFKIIMILQLCKLLK